MHAEIKLGDAVVFLTDDYPEFGGKPRSPSALGACSATIHQFVEDTDAAMERAVAAGATVRMPAMDAFWGDRYGVVTDPFGHDWSVATHQKDLTPEQIGEAAQAFFGQGG
jgi:uncharacterized glyoxalase superfamily protein PhnB